jgi:hypothetical protein
MSFSSDAILFYGYCWSEECDLIERGEYSEWEEAIAVKRGLVNPWDSCPDFHEIRDYAKRRDAENAWLAKHESELDAWRAATKAIAEEFGCCIRHHCAGEYPMPYIAIRASRICASRSNPEEVKSLEVQPDWDAKLERFITELGIEKLHESPRWWLVSYYG